MQVNQTFLRTHLSLSFQMFHDPANTAGRRYRSIPADLRPSYYNLLLKKIDILPQKLCEFSAPHPCLQINRSDLPVVITQLFEQIECLVTPEWIWLFPPQWQRLYTRYGIITIHIPNQPLYPKSPVMSRDFDPARHR